MKKNKMIYGLTTTFATVLLSSCVGAEIVSRDEVETITFSSGEITRATGNTWAAGDQIGITMYDATVSSVIGTYSNYCYEADANGANVNFTQKNGDMRIPSGVNNAYFAAYYPYKSSYTTSIAIDTYNNTQDDIMYASKVWNADVDERNIQLQFKYKLAKIIIKLVEGVNSPDMTDISGYLAGGYPTGTLDLKTGIISPTGSRGDMAVFKPTGNSNEFYMLVVPQSITSGVLMINTAAGSQPIYLTNQVYEAKEYTYTITINNGSAIFDEGSITDRTKEAIIKSIDI